MDSVVLEIRGLYHQFGGLTALNDVSFSVPEGDFLGVIGPNGAGKTTLFNVISGLFRPTKGDVFAFGRKITGLPPYAVTRLGIGRTFQIPRPFNDLTVLDNVVLSLGREYSSIRGLLSAPAGSSRDRERAREILNAVGLGAYSSHRAGDLPIGHKKRLEIARALATGARILLLDEPCAGLALAEARAVMEVVTDLNRRGITVLLVEHNMTIAMSVCANMVVLSYGRIIAQGPPRQISRDPAVIEAYLGRDGETI